MRVRLQDDVDTDRAAINPSAAQQPRVRYKDYACRQGKPGGFSSGLCALKKIQSLSVPLRVIRKDGRRAIENLQEVLASIAAALPGADVSILAGPCPSESRCALTCMLAPFSGTLFFCLAKQHQQNRCKFLQYHMKESTANSRYGPCV